MKMSQEYINNILHSHKDWIATNGQYGARADLRGTDLRYIDLRGAYLGHINLAHTKLDGSQLLDVGKFCFATVPERFLPWLSSHPRFAEWFLTLTIVED